MAIRMQVVGLALAACTMLWAMAGLHQATASCYNGKKELTFTKYWIAREGFMDESDDGTPILLKGPKTKSIIGEDGHTIAKVDKNTYNKCVEEGTCLLTNGDLINAGSSPDVFEILDRSEYPYGVGGFNNALVPFVSVATVDLPSSTRLFVKELHNVKLPNGKIHNGCVRVDDRGLFDNCHLDFFVLFFVDYKKLDQVLPDTAHAVIRPDCKILSYV